MRAPKYLAVFLVDYQAQFKVALRRYLSTHCFYSGDVLLMYMNDS
jgi:hypothetical protein